MVYSVLSKALSKALSPASAGTLPLRIWKKQWHNGYQQRSARGDFVAGGIGIEKMGGFYRWHSPRWYTLRWHPLRWYTFRWHPLRDGPLRGGRVIPPYPYLGEGRPGGQGRVICLFVCCGYIVHTCICDKTIPPVPTYSVAPFRTSDGVGCTPYPVLRTSRQKTLVAKKLLWPKNACRQKTLGAKKPLARKKRLCGSTFAFFGRFHIKTSVGKDGCFSVC